uniref:RRM domain-containing protein n=1 Tax=Anopheles quadriannulatus TaxID=34691 RepID=A0A182WXV9_ANOQN
MAATLHGADPATAETWTIDQDEEKSLTKIIVRNVNDLTVAGLRRMCSHYGTVVDVFKIKSGGTAFIEFSTDTEAGLAIQQLNQKLGFNYNAELAQPKETLHSVEPDASAPPQPDEDWEQVSAKRRFNVGFSLPLLINFPERDTLATNANYRAKEGTLRRTDPESFFRIYKVLETFETKKTLDYNPEELRKRVESFQKSYANEQNRFDGETLVYEGLTAKESALFDVTRCVVCKGYGFSYCKGCKTYYCSVQHQRQHYDEHNRICHKRAGGEVAAQSDASEVGKKVEIATKPQEVLTRDPLPEKAKVFITAILTPDRIYVRSAHPAADTMYLATLGEFACAGLTAVPVQNSKEPTAGDIYLAMYEPLGVHGRVLVTEVGPERSKCAFIDHGKVDFVSNGDLLLIEDTELMYRKVLIYKVCLTDITDEHGEHEKAMQYLAKLRDRPLHMKYRLEANNIVDVQLQTPEGESVNEQINRLIIIPPFGRDSNQYDSNGRGDAKNGAFVMYKEIPQSEPSFGESKQIMILNRTTVLLDSRITWIAMSDLPYLENLQRMLESYGKKVAEFRQSYVPREGEMCLVRCLNRWYRGVCYETAGDGKPAIFLCDYGSMTLVDLSNIRKIPPQLATKTMRTHDGVVEHLAEAKAGGLTLDSIFLDIYLPENEPICADISQRTVTVGLPGAEQEETYTVLNLHELSALIKSRQAE